MTDKQQHLSLSSSIGNLPNIVINNNKNKLISPRTNLKDKTSPRTNNNRVSYSGNTTQRSNNNTINNHRKNYSNTRSGVSSRFSQNSVFSNERNRLPPKILFLSRDNEETSITLALEDPYIRNRLREQQGRR